MQKQDVAGKEQPLHVKAGEEIEFPVAEKHPLAKFQTLTPVSCADDVQEFLKMWTENAGGKEQATPNVAKLVAQLSGAKLKVLRVATTGFRVDKGAVVTLNNPLNHLEFDNVTIAGDLVSRGDLILKCNVLSIA